MKFPTWTNSATKLVFVILALALIAFVAAGKVSGENFFTIVAMVFTAYYSKNRTGSSTEISGDQKIEIK